jgi:hypothetical protein
MTCKPSSFSCEYSCNTQITSIRQETRHEIQGKHLRDKQGTLSITLLYILAISSSHFTHTSTSTIAPSALLEYLVISQSYFWRLYRRAITRLESSAQRKHFYSIVSANPLIIASAVFISTSPSVRDGNRKVGSYWRWWTVIFGKSTSTYEIWQEYSQEINRR